MENVREVKIAVIGGGPAGLSAALAANEAGVNIARVVTRETDLETYFVNLVGGESHA